MGGLLDKVWTGLLALRQLCRSLLQRLNQDCRREQGHPLLLLREEGYHQHGEARRLDLVLIYGLPRRLKKEGDSVGAFQILPAVEHCLVECFP